MLQADTCLFARWSKSKTHGYSVSACNCCGISPAQKVCTRWLMSPHRNQDLEANLWFFRTARAMQKNPGERGGAGRLLTWFTQPPSQSMIKRGLGRNQEAGTKADTIEGCCLLACSLWLARTAFLNSWPDCEPCLPTSDAATGQSEVSSSQMITTSGKLSLADVPMVLT